VIAAPYRFMQGRLHRTTGDRATRAIVRHVRATTDLRNIATFVRHRINALFNGR